MVPQTLTLIFGEEAVLDAISRCWELDDLGWAKPDRWFAPRTPLWSIGNDCLCTCKSTLFKILWSVGSFDDLLLGSMKNIPVSQVPSSLYTRVLHLLTQEIYL